MRSGQINILAWVMGCLVLSSCTFHVLPNIERADQSEIIYAFEPIGGKSPSLNVDVIFRGNSSGVTTIHLPGQWLGQIGLEKAVSTLNFPLSNILMSDTADPAVKLLRHNPGQVIRVRYNVSQ